MLSFKVKNIYIFGDFSQEPFSERLSDHNILMPRSISEYHYSPAAEYHKDIDGCILVYNGDLTQTERLDVTWCYQNGVKLVVWDKTGTGVPEWLHWHALSVFTRREESVKVLLTSLGLFEQA